METTIWSAEIKGLEKLFESVRGHYPLLEKEITQLIRTRDPNVVMLYSRRSLEIIITDLCECELHRPRKTEPLKGIIDKLNSEEKVPPHIVSSMLSLNSMSTYGTHPKDFDPEQVKPVLNNLAIVIKWYLKYLHSKIIPETAGEEKNIPEFPDVSKKATPQPKKRPILLFSGIFVGMVIVVLLVINVIVNRNRNLGKNQEVLERTIAILPFKNLGNDSMQTYFCDGFMEEILNNLQRIREITVRSRTSTNQYRNTIKTVKTIGQEMNVNYIIEGSVAKDENNLKVWINLINVKTDEPVWSNDYTREISINQLFSLQSEIAKEIAGELKTVLSPEEINQIDKKPTENLEAYNYYLQAKDYYQRSFEKQNFEIAANMFEKATELDPDFALAYLGLSLCYLQLNWFYYDPGVDQLEKSKDAIDAALNIDPDLPEAHLALGNYYYLGYLNYTKALEQLNIAEKNLIDNPECVYLKANIYRRAGECSLAKENYLKAFQHDPGSSVLAHNIAVTLSLLGEYQEAENYFKKALMLNPTFMEAIWQKSFMYMKWKGNTTLAKATIEEAFQFEESVSKPMLIETNVLIDIYNGNYQNALNYLSSKEIDLIEIQFYINLKSLLNARIYDLLNMPEKAHEYYDSARITLESMILKDPHDSRLYSAVGIAYAGLGLKEKAIHSGKEAVELMPINKDAYRGVFRVEDLARIYVMVGEKEKALEQIKSLLTIPSRLSVPLLQLDPAWKPLWNLPGFKELTNMARAITLSLSSPDQVPIYLNSSAKG